MERKKKVLVVDDDVSILNVFKRILSSKGYAVDTAATAGEALKKAESNRYDVMLLDICLPDMEGTDLLQKLPQNSSEMVKIIVTGHSDEEHGIKASDLGADDYLVKPVKPEELLSTIKERLEDLRNRKNKSSCYVTSSRR
jgi:DNA-binding response OmpR family regulator